MRRSIVIFLGLILSVISAQAYSGEVAGKVLRVAFHLNNWQSLAYSQEGQAQIYIEGLPQACGTGEARVAISMNNPIFNSVVSAAMASQARGTKVRAVYLDSCTVRGSSWDLAILESLTN